MLVHLLKLDYTENNLEQHFQVCMYMQCIMRC